MKAAVWYGNKDVRVLNVPEPPAPPPGWVKIKVEWCGICGSDLHEYDAGPIFIPVDKPHPLTNAKAPLILGHEFSGQIVEVAGDVMDWKVGDRVAPDACQVCHKCEMCKVNRYSACDVLAFTGLMIDGAFAEYVNVPAYTLYKVPDSVGYEAAAVVEPLTVGLHGVRRGKLVAGETAAVIGAGTIGLSALQSAKAGGATKVYVLEMAKARKEFAMKLGATAVIDPSECDPVAELKRLNGGLGVDLAIECVGGAKTAPLAVDLVRNGGRAVLCGIFEKPSEIHCNNLVFFEKEIYGSLAYYDEFDKTLDFLADGRMVAEPMITAKIGIDDIIEGGFKELLRNREKHIKILVSPK